MKISKLGLAILVISSLFLGSVLGPQIIAWQHDLAAKAMEEQREEFITHKHTMIKDMMAKGEYRCCLEKPCTYCIEKTPGHGEGASCNCLEDVVTGKHPCGECMGEILEGHGNKYLKEYFPESLANELGEEHLDTIKEIIDQKYE